MADFTSLVDCELHISSMLSELDNGGGGGDGGQFHVKIRGKHPFRLQELCQRQLIANKIENPKNAYSLTHVTECYIRSEVLQQFQELRLLPLFFTTTVRFCDVEHFLKSNIKSPELPQNLEKSLNLFRKRSNCNLLTQVLRFTFFAIVEQLNRSNTEFPTAVVYKFLTEIDQDTPRTIVHGDLPEYYNVLFKEYINLVKTEFLRGSGDKNELCLMVIQHGVNSNIVENIFHVWFAETQELTCIL